MKTKKLPNQITVTITEEDRQNALDFCDNGGCILATATLRTVNERGHAYKRVSEGIDRIVVGVTIYHHPNFHADDAHRIIGSLSKPHYLPEVVGTKVVLCRRKSK